MLELSRRNLHLLLASALLLALVFAPWGRARAQDGAATLPLQDYWALIAAVRDDVHAARALDGEQQRAALQAAAGKLAGVQAVTLPDGSAMPVDNGALVRALRSAHPDLEAVEGELAALRQAADGASTARPPADAEGQLAGIVARPEFQYQSASPADDFLARLLRTVLRAILDVLSIPGVGQLLVAAGALVLGAVLFWVARGVIGESVGGAPLALPEGALPGEDLSAAQALQRANSLAAGGDYRSAVRYLYLSTLLFLEEAGRLRYDRALTNREYLRQVQDQPDVAEPLRAVVGTFERAWYGFVPVDARAYESFVEQVQALRRVRVAA